jgi:ribosomal protein S18 acetylase RimI-like enzyme
VRVRRARLDDAAAIAEVHVRTWQDAYEHVFGAERLTGVTVEQRLPMWRQILQGADQTAFVAEGDGGNVIGWCTVGPSRDDDADGELWGIYVLSDAWGTGAGTALMAAGIEALRDSGCRAVILWVLEDNPRARRFYEREGWVLDGERKEDEFLGVAVTEVRYRRGLTPEGSEPASTTPG